VCPLRQQAQYLTDVRYLQKKTRPCSDWILAAKIETRKSQSTVHSVPFSQVNGTTKYGRGDFSGANWIHPPDRSILITSWKIYWWKFRKSSNWAFENVTSWWTGSTCTPSSPDRSKMENDGIVWGIGLPLIIPKDLSASSGLCSRLPL
jgi:hypothetical protein